MVEVMKIMVASFKRPHACTAALSAPDSAAGHHQPTPLPETPEHSWASLGPSLVGSLLLSPGSWCAQVLCVPSKSLFPQCCVSSGSSMVGLMATPPRGLMTYLGLLHPEHLPLQQATADPYLFRRHTNMVLAQPLWGVWVLVCTRFF